MGCAEIKIKAINPRERLQQNENVLCTVPCRKATSCRLSFVRQIKRIWQLREGTKTRSVTRSSRVLVKDSGKQCLGILRGKFSVSLLDYFDDSVWIPQDNRWKINQVSPFCNRKLKPGILHLEAECVTSKFCPFFRSLFTWLVGGAAWCNIKCAKYTAPFKYSLRAEGIGDRNPVETKFFALVQMSLGVHSASYSMGTGPFPGIKGQGCGVNHPPHLAPRLRKE